ncbi:thioredoxin reductase [Rhizobium alvei]
MMNEQRLSFDVVVIGGGFAGVSAAMPLVRARKQVLLVDGARPRNRFTHASHGFLGQDGVSPFAIRATALAQLARYPGFSIIEREVMSARPEEKGFRLALDDGRAVMAKKLILACGVTARFPKYPVFANVGARASFTAPIATVMRSIRRRSASCRQPSLVFTRR